MGKSTSKSFSPHRFDGSEYGLCVSYCHIGPVKLVDNYDFENPTEGDAIGLLVTLVTPNTHEQFFSKLAFANYNESNVIAFDEQGVKIVISPDEIAE